MRATVLAVQGCVVAFADGRGGGGADALTTAERRQCAALPTAAHRADYRAARLAAKRAILHSPGLAPAAGRASEGDALRRVCVRRRAGGAPAVTVCDDGGRWRAARLALSLAHRDGRAVAAAASGRRVGVDVERAGGVAAAHARYFSVAAERERGPRDVTVLWALKEAAWKALALGADRPLAALALEFTAGGDVAAVVIDGRRLAARAAMLRPWRRHLVAVMTVEGM